jgi:hypothetical protein
MASLRQALAKRFKPGIGYHNFFEQQHPVGVDR